MNKNFSDKPWQYVAGEVAFLDCHFYIDESVLIPRQETEILADKIIRELPPFPSLICDLCCGSGCLGIAIKKKRPDCQVVLSDISEKALEVARRNALRNQVEVEICQGDLTAPLQGQKFDVIVCNPPYVSESDYPMLEPEVRLWEPKIALVGGPTGYEFYHRLAQEIPSLLHLPSKLYLEIGSGMGNRVRELFLQTGCTSIQVLQDWAFHDRFVIVEYKATPAVS